MFITEATRVTDQSRLLTWPRVTVSSLHYWITLALAALLLPLGAVTRLSFEPPLLLLAVFAKVGLSAIALAALLHIIDTPLAVTIAPFRVRRVRLLIPVVTTCCLVAMFGWSAGLFLSSVVFVIIEFFDRNPYGRLSMVCSFLLPALYLLVGIALVWNYNDIIVSVRFPGTYDPLFMRMDSWFGFDVPAISKAAAAFSPRLLAWSEQIYFFMFNILGATLILIAIYQGFNRAMQFVGAALLAYFISLALFFIFPSQGPYFLCVDHSSTFPNTLASYPLQMSLLAQAKEMWHHTSTIAASGNYFMSFPCMHVVKPTLALWYLRGHKKLALLLFSYLLVLPVAIVLLEMHYVVDIPVGFAIAAFVIYISDPSARRLGIRVPSTAAETVR